ncbi:DUF2189 domain-containing protein [Dinoroseobacter sp. PD6]|uniref:DUF2189 domain-containing protein n=1 Tax=Dinoroseobacter sp. PD6 TaxID=3028384 RepID=UPI00237B2336|nr:DUF2189 domain-containing protein [Dinoroseobacter sp. PD6]MDD9716016.1 DUF2189 domain-containing protein [Dinoroseobacter sp. PD6]
MTDASPESGAQTSPAFRPKVARITTDDLRAALALGWSDFKRAPAFGLFFSAVYVLGGLAMVYILMATGKSWATLPIIVGFPLIGPFAAVGLYEVSRRLQTGEPLDWGAVLGVVLAEKNRQMPSMAAVILIFFLFWNFLAHMIFALFLGLAVMTNITSSFAVFLTPNGMMMLLVGTGVGAVLSFVLYGITVVSLPLLLDKEVDFVTAMITSFSAVTENLRVMLSWGVLVAVLLLVGMVPAFLGLLLVLPLLGHATWHLYQRVITAA